MLDKYKQNTVAKKAFALKQKTEEAKMLLRPLVWFVGVNIKTLFMYIKFWLDVSTVERNCVQLYAQIVMVGQN